MGRPISLAEFFIARRIDPVLFKKIHHCRSDLGHGRDSEPMTAKSSASSPGHGQDVRKLTENKEHKCLMRYRSIFSAAILIALCAVYLDGPRALSREIKHEEHDEDRARVAVQRGEILPLEQVLAALKGGVTGEISKVELEKEHGIWVYEFKVISPGGRMMEVSVDAKTGKLIEKKGGD